MKLLVDAHVLDEAHQGTRTYIKGLYSELIQRRPDITFFFASYNLENLKSEIGHFPNVEFVKLKRGKFLRLLVEIPLLVRKHKIDYVHLQYIGPLIKNCKHIITTHDILFKDFKELFPLKYKVVFDVLFRISAARADLLFTVSEYSKKRISFHFKVPAEKIHITPNGVSSDFLHNKTVDNSSIKSTYGLRQFILYVSRIEPRKNHMMLLKAFRELRLWESGYQLVFVGKKDFLYNDIDAFVESCPKECRENVMMINNVSDQELQQFYKSASLFVYPSLAEGFGIPPIEAIAAGTQTLCSNTTAMSDFSFLGDDLFNPRDLEELKEKIRKKLSRPDDASRLDSLKNTVREKYSWTRAAKTFSEALEKNEATLKPN